MRRVLFIALLAVAFCLTAPEAASAHNAGGVAATDYKSLLDSFTPVVPGVRLSVKELGNRLQLTNSTNVDLVVLGYSGEPYLRVSKHGVYTNEKSPSYFLNQSLNGGSYVPPTAGATAAPEWHKTSSADVVVWHDHRIHWVSNITPAAVKTDPHSAHVVIPQWTVAMLYGSQTLTASGHLTWIPPRNPTPWYAIAVVSLLIGLGLGLTKNAYRLVAVALVVLVAIDVVHTAGLSLAMAGTTLSRVGRAGSSLLPSTIAWIVGVYGAKRLWAGRDDGPWYSIFAACLIGVLGGVSDLQSIRRSQVPFVWVPWLDRVAVSVSIGLGSGLFVSLLWLISRQRKSPAAAV